MAIQMASGWGSPVIATGRTASRRDICLANGAALAVNTADEDFVEAVMDFTAGKGADVALDMAGGPYLKRNLACMVSGGRLCYVAADGGRDLNLDVFDISLRSISITGVNLRHRKVAEKGRIADILRARIWPQIEQGRIRPVVVTVRPLAEAVDAHALLAAGQVAGKVVLQVR
jgi:NADPH:quinone reductase-like Zn-dependent oxidoreductase